MPRLTRRNKRLNRLIFASPRGEHARDKLRPVIHPEHPRTPTTNTGSNIQQLADLRSINAAIHNEPDVLTGVLINNVAHLERFSLVIRVKLKIQRPHIIRGLGGAYPRCWIGKHNPFPTRAWHHT